MTAERQRRVLSPAQEAALAKGRAAGTWKPGQSGNPRGPRPGLRDLRELLEMAMQKRDAGKRGTRLERMVIALARKLADADDRSLELVMRRVWPAPVQLEVQGEFTVHQSDAELADLVESAVARRAATPALNGAANGAHPNGHALGEGEH